MNGHDDMGVLGEYLSAFSTAGDVPTSLGGYGYGQDRHLAALDAFGTVAQPSRGLPRQPAGTGGVQAAKVAAKILQNYLNALEVFVTKSGQLDAETTAAWNRYVAVFKEPHAVISADQTAEGLTDYRTVNISKQALDRLKAKAEQTGRLRAEASRPIGSKPSGTAPAKPKAAPAPAKPGTAPGSAKVSTDEVQKILIALGQSPDRITDGKFGPTTKAKYQAEAKKRGLNTTITGANGAKTVTISAASYAALKSAAAGPAPEPPTPSPETKRIVLSTTEVQGVLKRLGYPPDRLSDGLTGRTTEGAWAESATKRKLDPFIEKASRDLKTVRVVERTYLMLKADADAKVPPDALQPKAETKEGGSLLSLPPETVREISVNDLANVVLSNLGTDVQKLIAGGDEKAFLDAWTKQATKRKLDGRIQVSGPGKLVVMRDTWKVLSKVEKPLPPPGPERDLTAEGVAKIVKESTTKISVKVLRRAFNAAIQQKAISREPFAETGSWKGEMRPLLLNWMGVADKPCAKGAQACVNPRDVWAAALVRGKLISDDKQSLKLPAQVAASLKDAASKLKAARQAEVERLKDFTEVNPAKVIEQINALGVSTEKFEPSGGAKELSDAVRTFFENTKTKAPSGDTVRTADAKVYLRTPVLVALASEAQRVKQRADATQAYRAQMVSNALRESTGEVSVKDFQQAIKHTVMSAAAGQGRKLTDAEKKKYGAVKLTGSFDKPTRAAFTLVARSQTIGPAVQQLQTLMQEQLGPKFKTQDVKEARNQVWNEYLAAAVSGGKIKTLPRLADALIQYARLYEKNVAADKRAAEIAKAQQTVLADAVAKSKMIVAVLDLQEALLQMAQPGRTKAQTVVKATGVKATGVADKATRDGLFQLASYIFPSDYALPETMWMAYLKEVGILVEGGRTKKGWIGATYLGVPQAIADLVSKEAGAWEDTHGRAAAAARLAPLPLKDEALLLRYKRPTIVTVRRSKAAPEPTAVPTPAPAPPPAPAPTSTAAPTPSAADIEKKAAKAAAKAAKKATEKALKKAQKAADKQREAQEAERLAQQAPEDAALRQQADQKQQEASVASQDAQSAAGEAQAAQEVATQAGGAQVTGPTITGPQITGPTIQITVPTGQTPGEEPVPIAKAGLGGAGVMAALGFGALALLLAARHPEEQDQDQQRKPQQGRRASRNVVR